jgi:hypothetical protein
MNRFKLNTLFSSCSKRVRSRLCVEHWVQVVWKPHLHHVELHMRLSVLLAHLAMWLLANSILCRRDRLRYYWESFESNQDCFYFLSFLKVNRVSFSGTCTETYMCLQGINLECSETSRTCVCIADYYWTGSACGFSISSFVPKVLLVLTTSFNCNFSSAKNLGRSMWLYDRM